MNRKQSTMTLDEAIDALASATVAIAKLPASALVSAALRSIDDVIDYLEAQHEARELQADDLQSVLTAASETAYSSGLAAGGDDAARLLACENKQLAHENQRLRQQLRGRWPGTVIPKPNEL